MQVRYFIDQNRTAWRVWAVRPAGIFGEPTVETGDRRWGHVLPSQWQSGWLVFEEDDSAPMAAATTMTTTLRRLAPIPHDWESCPETALLAYLDDARCADRHMV